jgi:hypothetical protein
MEDVLETYEKPYDPAESVVCLDEKPVHAFGPGVRPWAVAFLAPECPHESDIPQPPPADAQPHMALPVFALRYKLRRISAAAAPTMMTTNTVSIMKTLPT